MRNVSVTLQSLGRYDEFEKLDKLNKESVKNTFKQFARLIEKNYDRATATWENDKPEYDVEIDMNKGFVKVYVDYNKCFGNKKMTWLDAGVNESWALMSRNWRSKTKVNDLDSGRGVGYVLVKGKKNMLKKHIPPRTIEARNFSKMVYDEVSTRFQDAIQILLGSFADELFKETSSHSYTEQYTSSSRTSIPRQRPAGGFITKALILIKSLFSKR